MMPPVHATDTQDLQRQLDHNPVLRQQLQSQGGAVYVGGHRYQVSSNPPRTVRVNALGDFFDTQTARDIAGVVFRPARMNPAAATMDPAIATMDPAIATNTPATPTPAPSPAPSPSPAPALPAAPMMPAVPALSPQRARRIQQAQRRAQQATDQRIVVRPLRPGLPNIGHRSCYLNAVVYGIAQPWTEVGLTARLIAIGSAENRRHHHHHHHRHHHPHQHPHQQRLRWCLGQLLLGIENHAPDVEDRLRRFRRALAIYADDVGHGALQAMLPLMANRQVDDVNLEAHNPVEFAQHLVDCLGLDGDPMIYATRCTVGQTLVRVGARLNEFTGVIDPEIDEVFPPQLMLPLFNVGTTLQASVDAFFAPTDTMTGGLASESYPRVAVNDMLSISQQALLNPPPNVLTLTLPVDQAIRHRAAFSITQLGDNNRIRVPVARQGECSTIVEDQVYEVSSVVCVQERRPPAQNHYITLMFDRGGITVCDNEYVVDINLYRSGLTGSRASTSPTAQALQNFFIQTGSAPEMIMLTRVDNGASGSSSDTSPQPGTSRDSKP